MIIDVDGSLWPTWIDNGPLECFRIKLDFSDVGIQHQHVESPQHHTNATNDHEICRVDLVY